MKLLLSLFLLLPFTVFSQGQIFTDVYSHMSWEVPDGYSFSEEESKLNQDGDIWWYEFSDPNQSVLTIEIEKYDRCKDLTYHFNRTLTDEDEKIVFEGLEFKHLRVGQIEMSKCKVKALVISDTNSEPLYICDYFFVKDGYGISVGLMKKDDELYDDQRMEALMVNLVYSIDFDE